MLKVDQLLLQKNIPNGNLARLRGAKATQRVLGESNVDISSLSERKVSASEPWKTPRDMGIAAQRWNSAREAGGRCRALCRVSVLAHAMRIVLCLFVHCDQAAQVLPRPHSRHHPRHQMYSTLYSSRQDFVCRTKSSYPALPRTLCVENPDKVQKRFRTYRINCAVV